MMNFNELSEDCFADVYYPECEVIHEENGLEDKFGGNVPFFTNGMTWPLDKGGVPMIFLYQLRDPCNFKDITLHQAFISEYGGYMDDFKISLTKIILNDETLDNQVIIEKPSLNRRNTVYKTFEIVKWVRSKELKDIEYIMKKYDISDDEIELYEDIYQNHENTPSFSVKVGGTPQHCQYHSYSSERDIFLQITGCPFMDYQWGDAGIAHISHDCQLYWDCC